MEKSDLYAKSKALCTLRHLDKSGSAEGIIWHAKCYLQGREL